MPWKIDPVWHNILRPELHTPKSARDEGERTRNFILGLEWVICIYIVG